MKSVTEFLSFKLMQGLKAKEALAAEGKSPEEIAQAIGENFKLEGDKLKYFMNAMDVASQNSENLFRVQVVTVAEGENPPPKGTKVEQHYYIPEYPRAPKPKEEPQARDARGGRGKGKGRGKGGGRDKRGN